MGGGEEGLGAAFALGYEGFDGDEGLAEDPGLDAFSEVEVDVSGAEGEAGVVADDGANDDAGGEAEVGGEAPDDGDLGGVFLAEEGAIGFRGDKELGDDGGDALKVAGAGCAV